MQAPKYRQAGNFRGEYKAYFRFVSLIIDTLPKHEGFKKMRPSVRAKYDEFNQEARRSAMPRLEELKPMLRAGSGHHAGAVRPGASQIAVSNLSGVVDWAGSQPAHMQAATPKNFMDRNDTVNRQVLNLTMPSHTSADLGRIQPSQEQASADPFAASAAFEQMSVSGAATPQQAIAPAPPVATGMAACSTLPACVTLACYIVSCTAHFVLFGAVFYTA